MASEAATLFGSSRCYDVHNHLPVKPEGKPDSIRNVLRDGSIEWRDSDGKLHREGGPAREWPAQGAKAWYRNGKLHRDDGPAMEGPLGNSWYRNGKRHREDGPAVEHADGRKEWYRQGKELTEAQITSITEKKLDEIGDAFKTGLDNEATVSKPLRFKTSEDPTD